MKLLASLVVSIVLVSGCAHHQATNQHIASLGASVGLIVGVMLIGAVAGASGDAGSTGAQPR